MTQAFVSAKSQVSSEKLKQLLEARSSSQYFLRDVDKVSGFISYAQLQENYFQELSREGQMFDQSVELRWKRSGDYYNLLWLGTEVAPTDFNLITGDWQYEDRDAQIYPDTETRLPKGIKAGSVDIGQRYFRDIRTDTIHFIALRVK